MCDILVTYVGMTYVYITYVPVFIMHFISGYVSCINLFIEILAVVSIRLYFLSVKYINVKALVYVLYITFECVFISNIK